MERAERLRLENRVMAEMAALTVSDQEYTDVIEQVLALVDLAVSCPLLCLAIQEIDRVGCYSHKRRDGDPVWTEDAEQAVDDLLRHELPYLSGRQPSVHRITAPAAWVAVFPARSRSGRACALALAAPQPLSPRPDEEQLMLRLAQQAFLVLDHSLLMAQIEQLKAADELTGVTNHRRLLEMLDYEMQRHRYLGKRLALVLLDIEGLDGINRSYGRQYGDHILSRLAVLLGESVRPIDIVARCGMDEFAVVLPETDEEAARELAERLQERVLAARFAGGSIGVCTGVAHLKPDETLSAEAFLQRAEQALHEVKRQERDWEALWLGERSRLSR
jgi:diguanylate cyclase (GGDEF)-like protein